MHIINDTALESNKYMKIKTALICPPANAIMDKGYRPME
jgi:hypothetical protein